VAGEDLFLGAPQGQRWPLSLDDVEPRLRERFPDAYIQRRGSAVTGKSRLSFTVRLGDDVPRHGIYVDHDNLALSDGNADVWAETIAWFLSLLPPGTRTVAMRGEGPTVAELPAQIRTADSITAFFASLPA
jgi:hypothetical protein